MDYAGNKGLVRHAAARGLGLNAFQVFLGKTDIDAFVLAQCLPGRGPVMLLGLRQVIDRFPLPTLKRGQQFLFVLIQFHDVSPSRSFSSFVTGSMPKSGSTLGSGVMLMMTGAKAVTDRLFRGFFLYR